MTPGLPVQTEQGTALAFMNGGRVDPRSGLLCKQKLPHFDKALLKYFGGAASTLKFLRRVGVGICFREDNLSPQDFEELLLLIEGR